MHGFKMHKVSRGERAKTALLKQSHMKYCCCYYSAAALKSRNDRLDLFFKVNTKQSLHFPKDSHFLWG